MAETNTTINNINTEITSIKNRREVLRAKINTILSINRNSGTPIGDTITENTSYDNAAWSTALDAIATQIQNGAFNTNTGGSTSNADEIETLSNFLHNTIKQCNLPGFSGAISDYALYKRTNLETIKLGKLTKIGRYAFSGCKNIKTFEADLSGVTELGSNAFSDFAWATTETITLNFTGSTFATVSARAFAVSENELSQTGPNDMTIIFPATVSTIDTNAFRGAKNLTIKFLKADGIVSFKTELAGSNAFTKATSITMQVPSKLVATYNNNTAWFSWIKDSESSTKPITLEGF